MKIIHRFKIYAPDGAELGALPSLTDWNYSSPFCDIPSLNANVQDAAPNATLLYVPCEIAVETSIDGSTWKEPPNSRFLRIKRSLNAVGLDSVRKYTLPGYGWLLNKMRQMTTTGLNADGKRMFNSANAGMIMKTLIDENDVLGIVTGMGYTFNTTVDSNGAAWNKVISIGYEPGLDLFTILNNLADQGVIDWNFQGRSLQMYNVDTVLATSRDMTLQRGVDISGMPVEGSLEEMAHTALVLGDAGKKISRTNAGAPIYWGKWAAFVSQGGVSDTGTMELFADAALSTNGRESVQFTAEMPYAKSNFDPLYDFYPGDFLNLLDDKDLVQNYRIRGINFTRDGEGNRRVDLTLNDRLQEKAIRNARRTNGITSGSSLKGSGTNPVPDVGKRKPATATGLSATSASYIEAASGQARAAVALTYPGVSVDINSIAIEIGRYDFQAQKVSTTPWLTWGSSDDLTHTFSPIQPGEQWNVRYRAVSTTGVLGAWSATTSVTGAADITAPAKPSDPILSTKLGTVTITWDGLNDVGGAIDNDFNYLNIYRVGVTPPIASLISPKHPAIITDVTVGTLYEFFFKAVDRSGNIGPESDHASITVASIMDDPTQALDIVTDVTVSGGVSKITYSASAPSGSGLQEGHTWFQLTSNVVVGEWRWTSGAWVSYTLGNLVIAALDAGKITTGSLLAARIATDTITANMILAGAITGVKISADAIDGKVITGATVRTSVTGARVQIDSTGLKAFNSSNVNLVHLSSATGILYAEGASLEDATLSGDLLVSGNATVSGYLLTGSRTSTSVATGTGWLFQGSNGYADVLDVNDFRFLTISATGGTFQVGSGNSYVKIEKTGRIRAYGSNGSGPQVMLDLFPYPDDLPGFIGEAQFNVPLYANAGVETSLVQYTPNSTAALLLYGGSGEWVISGDGSGGRVGSMSIYDRTTGNAANVYVATNGYLWRSTSASKYKINIKSAKFDQEDVLSLSPITWFDKSNTEGYARYLDKGKGPDDPEKDDFLPVRPIPGFLAEDVERYLGSEFVEYGKDGGIEGIFYDRIAIPLFPIIAKLIERVKSIEDQLSKAAA